MQPHVLVLYSIIVGMKPDLVVEIGVRYGISTAAILLGLAENEKGKLCSIDINDSTWVRTRNHGWGVEKYWEFIQGYSQEVIWNRPIDILMIDGDHRYEMVKADFHNFAPCVRMGGIIILHDTLPTKDPVTSVDKFLPEIPRDTFELLTLPYSYGLTILRRLQDDVKPDLPKELFQAEAQTEVASPVRRERRKKRFEPDFGD